MTDSDLIARLIDGGRILEAEGLKDFTRGHISVRTGGDDSLFYMKPHSFGFEEITPENLVTCDLEGRMVAGGGRLHSEVFIHSEIFRARPDIRSIIHSHSPYAVAFAATGQEMEALSQPAALFLGCLPVFTGTVDLIRKAEQGLALARTLGPHQAMLLRGHGVVVAGASIDEAVILSLMLENACMIQLLAKATGPCAPGATADDVALLKAKLIQPEQYSINFEYLRRKLAKTR